MHESVAALISEILSYPVHTLWTVQQKNSVDKTFMLSDTYKKIRESGNVHQTFYKGFSIAAFSCIPATYLYLLGAHFSITLFGDNQFGQWMQGPMAQLFSTTINAPASFFIELSQASAERSGQSNNTFKEKSLKMQVQDIIKKDSLLGLYRGAMPHFFIYSLCDALGFGIRAKLLESFPERERKKIIPQLYSTTLGFSFAYTVLSPLSVIETRIRIHETNSVKFPDKEFFPAMKTLYKQRGIRGFFTGLPIAGFYGMVSCLPVACSGTY